MLAIYIAFLFIFTVEEAEAYIDPGTGSYLLQLAVGGLLAAAFTIRLFWRKLRSFMSNLFARAKKYFSQEPAK